MMEYLELACQSILVKSISWIYKCCWVSANDGHDDVITLVKNIHNVVVDHFICAEIDSSRKYVQHLDVEKKRLDSTTRSIL